MAVKKFTLHVKADVVFEAVIKAENLKEAVEKAGAMTYSDLCKSPGDIVDVKHEITAVFV